MNKFRKGDVIIVYKYTKGIVIADLGESVQILTNTYAMTVNKINCQKTSMNYTEELTALLDLIGDEER